MDPSSLLQAIKRLCSEHAATWAVVLLGLDALLTGVIIKKVPFTDIDWSTYLEQAEVFLGGETDYSAIRGSTGPIAYPWAHVYVYSAFQWLQVSTLTAQVLFSLVYLATIATVFRIYLAVGAPGWLMALCVV